MISVVIYNDENEIIFQKEIKGYYVQPESGPEMPMEGVGDDRAAEIHIQELEAQAQAEESAAAGSTRSPGLRT